MNSFGGNQGDPAFEIYSGKIEGRLNDSSSSEEYDDDDAFAKADARLKRGVSPSAAATWLAQQPISVAFGHGNLVGAGDAAEWLLLRSKSPAAAATWLRAAQGFTALEAAEWALANDCEHGAVADWMASEEGGESAAGVAAWAETSDWALQDVAAWLCAKQAWTAAQAARWIAHTEDGGSEEAAFLRTRQKWSRRKVGRVAPLFLFVWARTFLLATPLPRHALDRWRTGPWTLRSWAAACGRSRTPPHGSRRRAARRCVFLCGGLPSCRCALWLWAFFTKRARPEHSHSFLFRAYYILTAQGVVKAWQQRHELPAQESGALDVRSPASVSRGPSMSFDAPPTLCLGESAVEAAPAPPAVSVPRPCISDAALAADVAKLGCVPTQAAAPARERRVRVSKRPRTHTA